MREISEPDFESQDGSSDILLHFMSLKRQM